MILTADAIVAQATSRRKTPNGWHTTFIGKNRNTLAENEAAPAADCLYPMAFLVEKEAAAGSRRALHAGPTPAAS